MFILVIFISYNFELMDNFTICVVEWLSYLVCCRITQTPFSPLTGPLRRWTLPSWSRVVLQLHPNSASVSWTLADLNMMLASVIVKRVGKIVTIKTCHLKYSWYDSYWIKTCNLNILRQVYESLNIYALSIYHFDRYVSVNFSMYPLKSKSYIYKCLLRLL